MLMPIFPLLLILLAAASWFWYRQSQNDIFWALGMLSAVIGLAWGVVILHWSVQLVGLILLLKYRNSVVRSLPSD
jgi:hypothetical protein